MTKPNMADVLIAVNHILPKDGPLRIEQTKMRPAGKDLVLFEGESGAMAFAAREVTHKIKLQPGFWSLISPQQMEARNLDIQIKRLADPGNRHDPQSGIVAGNGYPLNKMRLDAGHLRMVTARRARTLKKRGVAVRWSGNLGWYTWRME